MVRDHQGDTVHQPVHVVQFTLCIRFMHSPREVNSLCSLWRASAYATVKSAVSRAPLGLLYLVNKVTQHHQQSLHHQRQSCTAAVARKLWTDYDLQVTIRKLRPTSYDPQATRHSWRIEYALTRPNCRESLIAKCQSHHYRLFFSTTGPGNLYGSYLYAGCLYDDNLYGGNL